MASELSRSRRLLEQTNEKTWDLSVYRWLNNVECCFLGGSHWHQFQFLGWATQPEVAAEVMAFRTLITSILYTFLSANTRRIQCMSKYQVTNAKFDRTQLESGGKPSFPSKSTYVQVFVVLVPFQYFTLYISLSCKLVLALLNCRMISLSDFWVTCFLRVHIMPPGFLPCFQEFEIPQIYSNLTFLQFVV